MLEQQYGLEFPPQMRESFGYAVKNVSDHLHKELMPNEIYDIFMKDYVNIKTPVEFINYRSTQNDDYRTVVSIRINDEMQEMTGEGNGRLDAVSNALQSKFGITYKDLVYKQHALETGSRSNAISYIGLTAHDDMVYWGCGIDSDITTSSVKALFSAMNKMIVSLQLPIEKEYSLIKNK